MCPISSTNRISSTKGAEGIEMQDPTKQEIVTSLGPFERLMELRWPVCKELVPYAYKRQCVADTTDSAMTQSLSKGWHGEQR